MTLKMRKEHVFKIKRNLTDAGCEPADIERFLVLEEKQKRKEQYSFLSKHKESLLSVLHQKQYQIDCLDFLVYTMEQADKKRKESE